MNVMILYENQIGEKFNQISDRYKMYTIPFMPRTELPSVSHWSAIMYREESGYNCIFGQYQHQFIDATAFNTIMSYMIEQGVSCWIDLSSHVLVFQTEEAAEIGINILLRYMYTNPELIRPKTDIPIERTDMNALW